ncbi:AAA family ATPase [Microbacterium excoecariae]|uniref:AAA family ATPase n=1 Tax=Microbacterium excoecariae TaxID=2715210 RepID=UPI00140DBE14|nr:SMC family ATPase [Microbacterium excoecariae]NHI16331.1 SMC family ATPase [Microbacterium excoecariae]
MRIHRIEIEGFGPFRARQDIDLDAYAADGLFLISGRTGAGKSSILDAVCFALYGTTPRYDSSEKRLRSDHAGLEDPTRIAVEFSVDDARWRIVRTPEYERPKRRGTGTTKAAATAEMFERVGDAWEGRAARAVDVGHLVAEIIGLSHQQFLQVILLAQGRFAQFLLAGNDDRQKLLRTLFGTRRFEDYEQALEERRRTAQEAVADRTRALDALLAQAEPDIVRALEAEATAGDGAEPEPAALDLTRAARVARAAAAAARTREDGARAERDRQEAVVAAQRAAADAQRRRDDARARLAALDAAADDVAAAERERDAAARADGVRERIRATAAADTALAEASAAADDAVAAWGAARDDAPADDAVASVPGRDADPGALEKFGTDMHGIIGAWEPIRERETGLATRTDDARAERERLDAARARTAALRAQREALPERIRTTRAALEEAAERAARRETAEAHIRELEQQIAAVVERGTLARAYEAAAADAAARGDQRHAAERTLDRLHSLRLSGFAGELAQTLAADEPCPVCGATSHPAPAAVPDGHATAEAIDEASAARDAAVAAHDESVARRGEAEIALRSAEQRAGGRSETEVNGDLLAARGARDDAAEAAREKIALERQRDELEGAQRRLEDDERQAIADEADLATRVARTAADLAAEKKAVAAARGAFDSVAERIGWARRLASRAAATAEARRERDRAAGVQRAVTAELAQGVQDAGFDTEDAARAALRDAARRAELDALIRQAGEERAAATAAIADTPADLPDTPIDLAPLEAALSEARARLDAEVAARADLGARAERLATAQDRARALRDDIAGGADDADAMTRLADTVAGRAPNSKRMNLETFVLAAELEEIVEAANLRLSDMSDERYSLQHTDALARRGAASGLGLEIMDRFTGQARPPHSLSGGETFLASLSLALGLAEVVTRRAGGIRLDTLFIDEGFGSLDAETLETAMRTLDELRQGGRTVGVISHVEAMKEQIPAQLRVRQTPGGWSEIDQ